jgi:hypothetical protein
LLVGTATIGYSNIVWAITTHSAFITTHADGGGTNDIFISKQSDGGEWQCGTTSIAAATELAIAVSPQCIYYTAQMAEWYHNIMLWCSKQQEVHHHQ